MPVLFSPTIGAAIKAGYPGSGDESEPN
jgi:hypothetical protein